MNERQSQGLQITSLSIVIDAKPSYAELEDMSEFERARHTSKTWSMGQDQLSHRGAAFELPGEITVFISVISIPLMIYFLYVNPLSDGLGGFASALDVGMAANPNAPATCCHPCDTEQ